MGQFSYKAVDQTGARVSGVVDAADRRSAVVALTEQGHFVTELLDGKPQRSSGDDEALSLTEGLPTAWPVPGLGGGHVSSKDVLAVTTPGGGPAPHPYTVLVPVAGASGESVRLYFPSITETNTCAADSVAPDSRHPAPPGTVGVGNVYYDVSSTTVFQGTYQITLRYDPAALNGADPSGIRLYHWKNDAWQDITLTRDLGDNTVTGETDSFSPFALFVSPNAQPAVIPTRPPSAPLIVMPISGLPSRIQASAVAASAPAAAEMFVVTTMCEMETGSAAIVEPGLKPNQPSHRMSAPVIADVML